MRANINTSAKPNINGQVIDGFTRSAKVPAGSKSRSGRPADKLHQRGQRAQTLMRGALQKPSGSIGRIQNLRPGFNPQRELRAKQTVKHSKVERFGGFVSSFKANDSLNRKPLLQGEIINRPSQTAAQTATSAAVLPSMITSASHQRLERMLDEALTKATAHKEALKYHAARHFWQRPGFFSKNRRLKLSVLLILVTGLSLFFAWQKIPQLSIKVAALRAHIQASAPAYEPAGYKVSGPAKSLDHAVTIQYASASDKSKVYTVQEQSSTQDSSSLIADNSSSSQPVQTAQANGIPIVIVKNTAKCVSDGLMTTVTNNAGLSADELLNIAKSVCA
ncbi:MAG TPA: DUF4367 domain-containing protein [Candidatus Saccharimonadales bacterium]|nr:DUF4367 domain-containing protein [Candidatus Saccharimonadales bacterium]